MSDSELAVDVNRREAGPSPSAATATKATVGTFVGILFKQCHEDEEAGQDGAVVGGMFTSLSTRTSTRVAGFESGDERATHLA